MNAQTQENRIRLILMDDHALFRASVSHFLSSMPDIDVVGESGSFTGALEILNCSPVDIVLLDFDLGSERGNEFIPVARAAGYQGRFLIVAGTPDVADAATAFKLGASGIFLKSEAPDRLVQAIRVVANGGVWIDQKVMQLLANLLTDKCPQLHGQKFGGVLTERERRVVLGILGGLTNEKIADSIGLSLNSVKSIVHQLYCKAGVRNRSQLVRAALEGSLVPESTKPVAKTVPTSPREIPAPVRRELGRCEPR